MRDSGAPEDRGYSRKTWTSRLGDRLTPLCIALLLVLVPYPLGAARGDNPPERHLLAAPNRAKPNLSLPSLAGAPQTLEQHAGRIVLVHFFATWCEPCREELTSLSRLAASPQGGGISILAVNVAEVPARVARFLETSPVNFAVLLDVDRTVTRAWNVGILPTTFVLDPALRVRLFVEGDVDWSRPDIVAALKALDAGTTE